VAAIGKVSSHDEAASVDAGVQRARDEGQALGLFQPLDEDLDLASAGQPYLPGRLVGDAELERLRLTVGHDLFGLGDHLAFHATARDGALEAAICADHQLPTNADRGRPPRTDDGGKRDAAILVEPAARGLQHVVRLGAVEMGGGLGHRRPRVC
jgi:hypothetical protein